MTMTYTSLLRLSEADAYDIWPLDESKSDWTIVVFREGFSFTLSGYLGPIVWMSEREAQRYIEATAPNLPRHRCDPGPRK